MTRASLLLLASLAAASALGAPARRPITVEDLLATRRPGDVQVSPDGKWVAFTVAYKSLAENRDVKDIWLAPLPQGPARPFTRDGRSEHPRWSPDGSKLLVVSRRGDLDEPPQLWLWNIAKGGDPRRLTSLWGGADGGVWSPDGRWIAFTSEVYPPCTGGGTGAAIDACNRKKVDERAASKVRARIVDHLFARHWMEWREAKRTHLFVLPLSPENAEPRDLTPVDADWPTWRIGGAEDYAFTPDGAQVIVSAKPAEREAWSTNSDLWAIPTAGGAPKNLTAQNTGDDATPRVSPDGKWIAYRSQALDGYEADQWKLKLLDRQSGKVTVIGDFDDDADSFAWRPDSKGLVVTVPHHGREYLQTASITGEKGRFAAAPASGDFDLAPDGSAIAVMSGLTRPPEIYRLPPGGEPVRLTDLNTEQYRSVDLGPAPAEQWVDSGDGMKIHAWVVTPPGLAQGKKAPLITLIHGGPQGAWEDQWGLRWSAAMFASRGYVVLMPNPRGSTGFGHAFKLAISKAWDKAYGDVMRSVDAAEKLPMVQPGQTCAAGASFGGYLVNWIAGQTDRFRCLVSHDGLFDLVSMYGSTEELWFPEFEFGTYWEQPERYRRLSPSSYVQNFKTPTLVVEGELDFRVAGDQALGMFTALQRRGVESRLLWFPDEGHWVLKPRNSQLWYQTVLDWIDAHAKGKAKNSAAR